MTEDEIPRLATLLRHLDVEHRPRILALLIRGGEISV